MKLLYAEDEPAMAEAVTDILNYHNFMVDAVADGEEALAYARAGDYDGIILDIMLPKLSGLDVLRELREGGCRTPVLLIHGEADGFVPCEMSRENYAACAAPKRLLTIPGADHAMSFVIDEPAYTAAVREFLAECGATAD